MNRLEGDFDFDFDFFWNEIHKSSTNIGYLLQYMYQYLIRAISNTFFILYVHIRKSAMKYFISEILQLKRIVFQVHAIESGTKIGCIR